MSTSSRGGGSLASESGVQVCGGPRWGGGSLAVDGDAAERHRADEALLERDAEVEDVLHVALIIPCAST